MFLKIVNDINKFFEDHKQVNDIGFGSSSDISTNERKFPMVWVEPIYSPLGEFEISYKFNIYSFTLYEQDKENLINSLNDTQLILLDFMNYFKYYRDDEYDVVLQSSIEPFTGKFDNYTNGWIMNITFSTMNNYDSCNIPN